MPTVEQIEQELRQLPAAEQKELLAKLTDLVLNNEGSATGAQHNLLPHFFAEWDANHSVTVGETPNRERTYAGNPRLR